MAEKVFRIVRYGNFLETTRAMIEVETIGKVVCPGICVAKRWQSEGFFGELQDTAKIMGHMRML